MNAELRPVRVNRAPVLTLWAAVVAERLGHPPDTALSLAGVVAATAAPAERADVGGAGTPSQHGTTRLLGRDVLLTRDSRGELRADAGDGNPAPAAPIAAYLGRAFGRRLAEVRAAMAALAGRYDPPELNRIGLSLYEQFRPDIPAEAHAWGAKGELHLTRVLNAGA